MMRKVAVFLLGAVLALLTCAETYNGVEYSTAGDVVPGKWTSQFSKAKSYADAKNIPLVVVWANPGCGFCAAFESGIAKTSVRQWMASRNYVFVFCLGLTTADGSAAWDYTLTKAYPMCRVHWKKDAKGKSVDYTFVGRSGQMHASVSSSKGLDVQFKETVDLFCGDYAGGTEPTVVADGKHRLTVTASGDGTVSGGGLYKEGKTAYLRASAKSGSVFSGWFAGSTLLSQEKSFAYKTTDADVSIVGKFIPKTEDAVEVSCPLPSQYTRSEVIEPVVVTVRGNSKPSVSVSGLPAGLTFRQGQISGKPTRSGVYTTTVTGRTAGGAKQVKTFTIVVSAPGEYYVKVPCEATLGKVSGQGVYAAGKKVTLRMSVKRGYVFMGWRRGPALLSQDLKYAFTMPSDNLTLTPEFVTDEEDLAAVSLVVDNDSLEASTALEKPVMCGVKLSWDVLPGGLTPTTVSFSSLPPGLKYNAASRKLEGAPTKAKRYVTKAKVRTAGGNVKAFSVVFAVEPLPKWVVGNFFGGCTYEGKVGCVKLTIASSGKVSGKLNAAGTSRSFSAACLDACENGFFSLNPTVTYSYKEGKKTVKVIKALALRLAESGDLGRIGGDDANGLELAALQNVWERKDLAAPEFAGGSKAPQVEFEGGLKVKIGKKGTVKIGGKVGSVSVSGESQLVAGFSDGRLSGEAQTVLSVSKKSLPEGYFGTELDFQISDKDHDGKIETVRTD